MKLTTTTILGMTVIILLGYEIPGRIGVTITPSMRHRIYYVRPVSPGEIPGRGAYIITRIRSEYIHGGEPVDITKRVVCAPGDALKVTGHDYYCNNRYLGSAKTQSLAGKPVDNFVFNGVIPARSLFVMGDSKDSFDSRYFGFIEAKNVTAIEYPIF